EGSTERPRRLAVVRESRPREMGIPSSRSERRPFARAAYESRSWHGRPRTIHTPRQSASSSPGLLLRGGGGGDVLQIDLVGAELRHELEAVREGLRALHLSVLYLDDVDGVHAHLAVRGRHAHHGTLVRRLQRVLDDRVLADAPSPADIERRV